MVVYAHALLVSMRCVAMLLGGRGWFATQGCCTVAMALTVVLLVLLSYAIVSSEGLSLTADNITVALQDPAVLNCTLTGYSGAGTVSILISKRAGFYSPANDSLVESSRLIFLESAQYSDNGQYICTAMTRDPDSNETTTLVTSFYVNIQGYEPPQRQSAGLFGLVKSSEQSLVDCPLVGVPGPSSFYWERGDDLNTTGYMRVTTLTNVTSGPFVNKQGQLDLTLAREEDSMFYLCIGVDVAGANASQLFRVEVIVEEVFVLWVQWYMILAYCVVGIFIVIVTAIVVWYICANRHECYVRVKKRQMVKKRVRREALMEVFKPPPRKQTIGIDNSFFETYRGGNK